jgi:hypothetical protein
MLTRMLGVHSNTAAELPSKGPLRAGLRRVPTETNIALSSFSAETSAQQSGPSDDRDPAV